MYKKNNNNNYYCSNCGRNGHAFSKCRFPITSIGVIPFRYSQRGIEYMMICRKDTLGYVDFMRGKYTLTSKSHILKIIDEMTEFEKKRLLNDDFEYLWNNLWGETVGIQYRGEKYISKEKFDTLKIGIPNKYSLSSLIHESSTKWSEPEWGFPKGRRNYREKDIACGLREFEEETGYSKYNVNLIQNIIPFDEIFTGSNYKSYKHKYYLGYIPEEVEPVKMYQTTEVSKIQWKTYNECINSIRDYNLEKKSIISRIHYVLLNYRIYI